MKWRHLSFLGVGLVVVLMLFFGIGYVWFRDASKPVSDSEQTVRVVIPKGFSASQVGQKLYQSGLVRSPFAFKIYLQLTNSTKIIKPGEYTLKKNQDLREIVKKLLEGPDEVWVTIPEGLRREEIALRVADQLELEESASFIREFMEASDKLEGYLFPDTYLFPRDIKAEQVVRILNGTFEEKYAEIAKNQEKRKKSDIVKMASIIEREAREDNERPVISGILWKRYDSEGWLIQADATVQYVLGSINCTVNDKNCNWWPIPKKKDLEIDSPFNTYLYKSLPPTPISNPGSSSLKASIYPQESEYWFYIHGKDGNVRFARNLEEHNANIAKYIYN